MATLKDFFIYDDTGPATVKVIVRAGRTEHIETKIPGANEILVVMEEGQTYPKVARQTYDPTTKTFSVLTPLPPINFRML